MGEDLKDAIAVPDAIFRKRCRRTCTVSILIGATVSLLINYKGIPPMKNCLELSCILFAVISGIWIELAVIERFMRKGAERARAYLISSIAGIQPIPVRVKRPTSIQSLNYHLNGRLFRHAVGMNGRRYSIEFRGKQDQEFDARLYQIHSKWFSLTQKYAVVPESEDLKKRAV